MAEFGHRNGGIADLPPGLETIGAFSAGLWKYLLIVGVISLPFATF